MLWFLKNCSHSAITNIFGGVVTWPDLRWPCAEIFRQGTERMRKKVFQKQRRCASQFFTIREKILQVFFANSFFAWRLDAFPGPARITDARRERSLAVGTWWPQLVICRTPMCAFRYKLPKSSALSTIGCSTRSSWIYDRCEMTAANPSTLRPRQTAWCDGRSEQATDPREERGREGSDERDEGRHVPLSQTNCMANCAVLKTL